jgi:hypothetical protein
MENPVSLSACRAEAVLGRSGKMPTALLCAEAINVKSPIALALSSVYVVTILSESPHRSLEVSKSLERVDFRADKIADTVKETKG